MFPAGRNHDTSAGIFFGSSRKVGGANKGLGVAPKAARGRSMKARPTQSRRGVKGGLRPFSSAPCRVKGQRPLWGLGQRPNCFSDNQFKEKAQARCRQRSVPASNFARPQTRPPSCSFHHLRCVAPNGRDRRAWKQTKSAIARWKPLICPA